MSDFQRFPSVWPYRVASVLCSVLFAGCGQAVAPDSINVASGAGIRTKAVGDSAGAVDTVDQESSAWNFAALSPGMAALARGWNTSSNRRDIQLLPLSARLKSYQCSESRGFPKTDPDYGGTGPNEQSRPDLPHTALMLEALRRMGMPTNDPYIQRAVSFVSRCQRLDHFPTPRADGADRDDGGFALGPIDQFARPEAVAGIARTPCGVATAMAVTSLLAAGVARDDARILGGLKWLKAHYSLAAHPGMAHPNEGLYRYYYEFAKAMRALGADELRDGRGVAHDWRGELEQVLASRQEPNGSWINLEESPEAPHRSRMTVTSYALLTLNEIRECRAVVPARRRGTALVSKTKLPQ